MRVKPANSWWFVACKDSLKGSPGAVGLGDRDLPLYKYPHHHKNLSISLRCKKDHQLIFAFFHLLLFVHQHPPWLLPRWVCVSCFHAIWSSASGSSLRSDANCLLSILIISVLIKFELDNQELILMEWYLTSSLRLPGETKLTISLNPAHRSWICINFDLFIHISSFREVMD